MSLFSICVVPMVLVCMVVSSLSTSTLQNVIEEEVGGSLEIVATSVRETYANLYEGDYSMDLGGKVKKGDKEISGDYQLVDAIKSGTGYDVSFLFGDMRLITTVRKENGSRANGTKVDKELYQKIQEGAAFFQKDAVIRNKECYVYYLPIVNADGTVLGAIEAIRESASIRQAINGQVVAITSTAVVLLFVVGGIAVFVSSKMVKRMSRIGVFLESLISGRLDFEPHKRSLKRNDELGDIYRNCAKVQDTFKDMVRRINDSYGELLAAAKSLSEMAENTTESAENVSVAVEEISEGARTQADSTQEARDNVTQMSAQIGMITQEVDAMAEYAGDMAEQEKESERIVEELSISGDRTKKTVAKVAEQIAIMNHSVSGIKEAVSMIQSIADETDLLSLNASIEAARAGAAGRGFAVVAEQISKLSLSSAQSSREIEHILGEISKINDTMVAVMAEVSDSMDVQQCRLEETKVTYRAVSESVEKSLENIQRIKGKIDILNTSGNSINETIESLAAIAEQNAASASNTMEATENMNGTMNQVRKSASELLLLADRLQETLAVFRV